MSESERLELSLDIETERQERQRVWKSQQTQDHLAAEARDYITLSWSMRMASAVEHLSQNASRDTVAGTLRYQGNLQDVVLLLDHIGHQRCSCRREFEETHDLAWGLEWIEQDSNHKNECIMAKARKLLTLLEGE